MAKGLKENGGLWVERAERKDGFRAVAIYIESVDGMTTRVFLTYEQTRELAQGLMAEANWASGEDN